MDARYNFGPFRLDFATRELWRGDALVALTPKAFDLLRTLVTSGGRVVEKESLLKSVWPDSFVGEDSLTQSIAALRKALGDTPDRQQYIVTVPRHGYRFVAPVQLMPESPSPVATLRDHLDGSRVRRGSWMWIVAGVAAFIAIAGAVLAIGVFQQRDAPSTTAVYRFVVDPPPGTSFSASASFLAVSPDGRLLAFLATRPGEASRLWMRALDSLTARELIGTDGALGPFWSPDSRELGFFADGLLKKVGISGGSPMTLCDAASRGSLSGSWHKNGSILFTHSKGIYRISPDDSAATPVTVPDQTRGELARELPQFLPDGRHFLFMTRVPVGASFQSWLAVRSLDGADDHRLLATGSQALLLNDGSLMFVRDGGLVVQSFDLSRLQMAGDSVPIPGAERVGVNPAGPRGMFSASRNGVLAYRSRAIPELGWLDRSGNPLGSIGAAGDGMPALSHDGLRVTISRYDASRGTRNLWLLDLKRGGVASRITSHSTWDTCPVWSPDDRKIVFARGTSQHAQVYEVGASEGTQESLVSLGPKGCPLDWSRDGRYLLFSASPSANTESALWVLPVQHSGQPTLLDSTTLVGPRGSVGSISPNTRWLAYESVTAGRREIYVRAFPNNGSAAVPVSSDGGIEPQWRGDGRELFFLGADNRLMAVPVNTEGTFRAGTPTALFSTKLDPAGLPIVGRNQYLVTSDGQRFLLNQPRQDAGSAPVTVIINWPATLTK